VGRLLLKDQHDGWLERRCIASLATLATIFGPENPQEIEGELDDSAPLAEQGARTNKPIISLIMHASSFGSAESFHWLCSSCFADLAHPIEMVDRSSCIFTLWNVAFLRPFPCDLSGGM
jgi:hypothetical protein